jgi:hypothetical protein
MTAISTMGEVSERLSPDALRRTVVTFRDQMRAHANGINRLNVYPVPDGDTGSNMASTLDAVVAELESTGIGDDSANDATFDAISHGSLMGARGNSGVILSQILRGFVTSLKGADATATKVADSLRAASQAAYQSVLKPIEGTILTVAREAADAGQAAAADGATVAGVLRAARDAGRRALDRTPELLPALKEAGVVDAGGAGLMLFFDSALHVVDGEPLAAPSGDDADLPTASALSPSAVAERLGVASLRYEVMFFLDLAEESIEQFKQRWAAVGDSIVVVGGDGLWNCHVHTNDVGGAIEVALDVGGRPRHIRVSDLFDEAADEHMRRDAALASAEVMPQITTAVVAVASGDGIASLFRRLGVQQVVGGGQSLNPSTAELLAAVDAANADEVVVLPNNKNIIAVAEQLDALTAKRVLVVPTRSMPEALAALMAYDADASAADNADQMCAAATAVMTGEVTRAVRQVNSEAGAVRVGDWIGLVKGDGIVVVHDNLLTAAANLVTALVRTDSEIVTVLVGQHVDDVHIDALAAELATRHPHLSIEVHHGGQQMYPFLFGVE